MAPAAGGMQLELVAMVNQYSEILLLDLLHVHYLHTLLDLSYADLRVLRILNSW